MPIYQQIIELKMRKFRITESVLVCLKKVSYMTNIEDKILFQNKKFKFRCGQLVALKNPKTSCYKCIEPIRMFSIIFSFVQIADVLNFCTLVGATPAQRKRFDQKSPVSTLQDAELRRYKHLKHETSRLRKNFRV